MARTQQERSRQSYASSIRRLHHRAGSFTNRARMAKLLALMTLELTGRANPRAWADRIHERLYLTAGHPINQRPTTTPSTPTH